MDNFSRRDALKGIGGLLIASTLVGCEPYKILLKRINKNNRGVDSNQYLEWSATAKDWWNQRQEERQAERKRARAEGNRPEGPLPFPYLECGRYRSSRGWLGDQVRLYDLNEQGEIAFIIENRGNTPSQTCYAEVYESSLFNYGMRFDAMDLRGRVKTTVFPGERKEVVVPWRATRESGSICIRCFDPLRDPPLLTYQQYDRKNSGVGWSQWIGN